MINDDPPRRGRRVTGSAAERLRVVLGAIGDEASTPRPFERLADDHPSPSTTRRPVVGGMISWVAVGCVALIAAVVLLRLYAPGSVITEDEGSTASQPSPRSNPDASTTASSGVTDAHDLDGPWYAIDLADTSAGWVSVIGSFPNGSSTDVWVSADGSYNEVLVLTRFADHVGGTTLVGEPGRSMSGVDGALNYVVSPDDPPDPGDASLAGDEMRWLRADGSLWEFTSYGMAPAMLAEHVLNLDEEFERGCPCTSPGLEFVGTDAEPSVLHQQTINLQGTELVLTRATSPVPDFGLARAGLWRTAEPRLIDSTKGVVADGDQAVWQRDGFWFTLTDLPPERLNEVLRALRPVDLGETVDTAVPETTSGTTCDRYTVLVGDYLAGIADSFGLTVEELTAANKDLDHDNLYPGTVLAIPC